MIEWKPYLIVVLSTLQIRWTDDPSETIVRFLLCFSQFFFVGTEWSWSTPCVVRVLANCSRQKQPVMWFHICDFIRVLKSWLTTHPPNAWEILGFTEFSNPSFMVGSSYEKTGTARHGLDFQGGNQSLHPDVHYFKAQGSGDSPRCLQNLHPSRCP